MACCNYTLVHIRWLDGGSNSKGCATVALLVFNNTPRKLVVSLALTLEAALVCISRVYVGGHYPLDVVGGILLGVGVALIFVGVDKSIEALIIMPLRKKILKR